jgi:hypothetical protein
MCTLYITPSHAPAKAREDFKISITSFKLRALLLCGLAAAPLSLKSQIASDSAVVVSSHGGFVNSVSLINPWQLERQRLAELAGDSTVFPMTLRSVSASIARLEPATRTFGVFRPEIQIVSNSALPF